MSKQPLTIILSFLCLMAVTACGNKQLQVVPHTDRLEQDGERIYGTIALTNAQTGETANKLHVKKIDKGYGLQGRMHEKDNIKVDFVAAKHKEFKYFSGLKFSWSF